MTPIEIETQARNKRNAVSDTFYTQQEIFDYIRAGIVELVVAGHVIERTYTRSTVASTQEYAYPEYAVAIRRIEYNGEKLEFIDFRFDDQLTLYDADTTNTGTPRYYFIWNNSIFLRPIPDAVGTLKIFSYNEPQPISSTSEIEAPTIMHLPLTDFVVREMSAKDQDTNFYDRYDVRWANHVQKFKQWNKKRLRADGNARVKNEDIMSVSFLGRV